VKSEKFKVERQSNNDNNTRWASPAANPRQGAVRHFEQHALGKPSG